MKKKRSEKKKRMRYNLIGWLCSRVYYTSQLLRAMWSVSIFPPQLKEENNQFAAFVFNLDETNLNGMTRRSANFNSSYICGQLY